MSGARIKASGNSRSPLAGPLRKDFDSSGVIDPAAVREQLARILASSHFRNSKRYPAFLSYVVNRTLNGASSELKERNLGVDVFGRPATYDPSADPVVRISAGEVRKRLAQYYQEAAREHELRIELPLGSYLPNFIAPESLAVTPSNLPIANRLPARISKLVPFVAAGVILLIALALFHPWSTRTALDLFWSPVITPGGAVTLCVGRGAFLPAGSSGLSLPVESSSAAVAWWDAETLARLAGLLQSKGASLKIVREYHATFGDFQQTPAVLIGAFNDQWTLQLMEKMRFTFERNGSLQWIADRDRPSFRDWKINLSQTDGHGDLAVKQDYAVISRVANPRTGWITVTVAGLWGYGTNAAGRFLTDPKYLQGLSKHAPAGWQDRNMQIVIGTEVIQGSSGPPAVLATAFW